MNRDRDYATATMRNWIRWRTVRDGEPPTPDQIAEHARQIARWTPRFTQHQRRIEHAGLEARRWAQDVLRGKAPAPAPAQLENDDIPF